jgi:hypothetical protein
MDNPQQHHNKPAFVLGNGTSRVAVDPKKLLNLGTVYGCNAQYREYEPDFLIAVDVKMINEIIASGYHRTHAVWTNPNKGVKSKDRLNFFNPHKGWSSGPTALWFAAQNGHREIYILGFDYQGLNGKFNNVYANTYNYKKSTDAATFFGNWLSQTKKVISEFKHTKFYRVVNSDNFTPTELKDCSPNFNNILYDDFDKKFNNNTFYDQNHQKSTI